METAADKTSFSAIMAHAVGLLTLLLVLDGTRTWYRLSHVPGPFWAAFSKYWMVSESLRGRQPYAIQAANDKYGSLVRIGPNELATDDPEMLRRMMAPRSRYSRGPWYNALRFEAGKDNLFSMRDDNQHGILRNKMAAGYSGKENESMEHTIDKHIQCFIELLQVKYLSADQRYRPVDFARKVQYFTLDVISDLAFAQPFGVANKKVAERFGPNASSHPDMLQSFIRHGLNQEEASRESLLNVVAGSDTTATTIRVMMLCLLSNPLAYANLQKEIDNGIKVGNISSPVSNFEARQLPYLQAAIKEGLRIKAPAAGPLFKTVPPEGDIIDGKKIPGGTQIGISPFGIYHSKKIFGEDADMFLPERWLGVDTHRVEAMSRVVDLVFSAGKYQCLGKPVALMELNKIFVELMRRFEFAMARPEKPIHIINAGIWLIEDFPVPSPLPLAQTVLALYNPPIKTRHPILTINFSLEPLPHRRTSPLAPYVGSDSKFLSAEDSDVGDL
ncbi:hypothetical protein PWT90_08722 [Aphanocladium album]|nr:hypothetical protein PWT90_08722 [Aphanocladium album]